MDGIPLKRQRSLFTEVDPKKCIICQQIKKQTVTSTEEGRTRIREAANIRQDNVTQRLTRTDSDHFVYHVSNDCYKTYTHKTVLQKLKSKTDANTSIEDCDKENIEESKPELSKQLRSNVKSRSQANRLLPTKRECVICGQYKNKGEFEKCRISESERARKFLEAVVYFKDEVYIRTCDLQDVHAVFGADLYCHKNCIRMYIKKYEDANKPGKCKDTPSSVKSDVFSKILSNIEINLKNGEAYSLSDLRDQANTLLQNKKILFSNRELRILLYNYYGSTVCFSNPKEANKSAIVFMNTIKTEDVVDTLFASDPVEQSAKLIRECLLQTDFNLDDKFCDASDLQESWKKTAIPDVLIRFFGTLFNFDAKSFYSDGMEDAGEEGESDDCSTEQQNISDIKRRKVQALFQILYFDIHNGNRRTPLHLMNAQAIHEKCKSRELITSFNHFGISVSYSELQRYHDDLANLIVETSDGNVPLPSQFDPSMFTISAFDNFDHEESTLSGIGGSHDTVSVLFQEKPSTLRRKVSVSETSARESKVFKQQLPCQEIREYIKPARKPDLQTDFNVDDKLYVLSSDQKQNILQQDISWTLSRMDLSKVKDGTITVTCEDQQMPSWSAFNSVVSTETVDEKIVGFLPVIPSPVTEYSTVYTALKNFQGILDQLDQENLAITCDEGVYHIAREITMQRPEEFSNLVLCLGSFHLSKVFLGCIGKYLRNSGAESIWTENAIFGVNVVQSVLGGTHYVRSFKGMVLLSEAMERIQWSEFFKVKGLENYLTELDLLGHLKNSIAVRDFGESRNILKAFRTSSSKMVEDFCIFREENCNKSETFRYWDGFIEMVSLLRNLVRADREGNWKLHLTTVQEILPYFAQFDCTNYLRWCSLYLEDMRRLPETSADIHHHFMNGKFVVKRTPGQFKAVGADQCLEQTINRSQKSSGGIIGSTRKKEYVTQWEMIYHEMLSVSSLHRELSGTKPFYHELTVNHEFSKSETKAREANVADMMSYVQLYDNPFEVTSNTETRLHNIITQEVMTDEIRDDLLNIKENATALYAKFRKERFIEKTKRLTDTIHRNNIKSFQSINSVKPKSVASKKKTNHESATGHRIIEVAKSRGYDTKQLFKYDLVQSGPLFDESGLMKKTSKSALCHELEKTIDKDESPVTFQRKAMTTVYLVDVMANMRKVNVRGLKTFDDLCMAFTNMVLGICKNAYRIDFVFDSYVEGSIKDSERIRRSKTTPIEISNVHEDTPLPVNMDTFWASITNKAKLENLLRKWITENSIHIAPDIELVLSGAIGKLQSSQAQSVKAGFTAVITQLNLSIEEADERLIPHAVHATNNGAKRIVILSGDTDVMVLALFFWRTLAFHGLDEIWMRAGIGDSTRYVPLHLIAKKNPELCTVFPAVHSLTGCDTTSKVGTKLSALKVNPVQYLNNFGKSLNDSKEEDIMTEAEHFLVKTLKPNTDAKTMDELRFLMYHHSKAVDIKELPPTSFAIRAHIRRALYNTYTQTHCLENPEVDPKLYGYEERDGLLIPSKRQRIYPEDLVLNCNCKTCSTKHCVCKESGIPCCIYCKCQEDLNGQKCRNPFVLLAVPLRL